MLLLQKLQHLSGQPRRKRQLGRPAGQHPVLAADEGIIGPTPPWRRDLGAIDVTTVLQRSSNVGAGKIALDMDRKDLWRVMDRLGFGQRAETGADGGTAASVTLGPSAVGLVGIGLGAGVLAPLAEELVFRGLALRAVRGLGLPAGGMIVLQALSAVSGAVLVALVHRRVQALFTETVCDPRRIRAFCKLLDERA